MKKSENNSNPLLEEIKPLIFILLCLIISLFIYSIYIIKNSAIEYKEPIKYFTGELYSANHAANLIDSIENDNNIALSPINYNASLGILYNITDNNSAKQLKSYFKKDINDINEEITTQLKSINIPENTSSPLDKYYLSLYDELLLNEYNKLTNKTIESLSDKEKETLYLLITKMNLTYEAINGDNIHTEKSLKNYSLKEKDITHNSYTIYLLLEKVLDQYETYNIKNEIVNINTFYYNDDLIKINVNNKDIYKLLQEKYSFEMKGYNLTENTLNEINSSFKEKTDNKLVRIIEESDLNKNYLYLNSLYFNYGWESNIKTSAVNDDMFYSYNGEEQIVEYMYDKVETYMENDYAKAFKKDFSGSQYSFIGILPKKTGEFKLSNLDLNTLLKNSKNNEQILISIPKFSYQSNVDLKEISEANKISEVFTDKANFTKLTEEKFHLERMIQTNYIRIAEKGTETTSINESSLSTFTVDESQKQVLLNRPFAYLIIDNETNNVILIGKVNTP